MPQQTWQIMLSSTDGGATSSPTVNPGDKVYWTAGSAAAFVNPPNIFSPQPNGAIDIDANASSREFTVNNNQNAGQYGYSSGLQGESRVIETVNDTIDVGSGDATATAGGGSY